MVQIKSPLHPGESLLKQSKANFQRGIETVGGHLYLTTQRLIFESHRFNVQAGATAIDLREVTGVQKGWTKFLGVLPIFPNAIVVATSDGRQHEVVCSKRGDWLAAIETARAEASA